METQYFAKQITGRYIVKHLRYLRKAPRGKFPYQSQEVFRDSSES